MKAYRVKATKHTTKRVSGEDIEYIREESFFTSKKKAEKFVEGLHLSNKHEIKYDGKYQTMYSDISEIETIHIR